jgi:chromosome segregation protein
MVSRLIEARPEDMRSYLEEAAGISRYKDRRRETELRIGHTRENLERLSDLREGSAPADTPEASQLAEKHKELKQCERRPSAELVALKLRAIDATDSSERVHASGMLSRRALPISAAWAEIRGRARRRSSTT